MHLTGGTGQYTTIEALSSRCKTQAFRCFRLPLPLPPTISVGGSGSFRCFRFPLPLPPTISVGGSGLPLLPPSAALASHSEPWASSAWLPALASHYLSGRLGLLALIMSGCTRFCVKHGQSTVTRKASAMNCYKMNTECHSQACVLERQPGGTHRKSPGPTVAMKNSSCSAACWTSSSVASTTNCDNLTVSIFCLERGVFSNSLSGVQMLIRRVPETMNLIMGQSAASNFAMKLWFAATPSKVGAIALETPSGHSGGLVSSGPQ